MYIKIKPNSFESCYLIETKSYMCYDYLEKCECSRFNLFNFICFL